MRLLDGSGYIVTRETGSHIRLTRRASSGNQHLTIPDHRTLRVGTLASILADVAAHLGTTPDDVRKRLFGRR